MSSFMDLVLRKDELVFNIKDYGATNGGDIKTPLQTIINLIVSQNIGATGPRGGTIYIPRGYYTLSGQVNFPYQPADFNYITTIRILGDGRYATTIKATGGAWSAGDAMFKQQQPTPVVSNGGAHEIAYMTLDANKLASRNIDIINGHAMEIHHIHALNPVVGNGYANIRITGDDVTNFLSWEHHIYNCRLEGGGGSDSSTWSDYNLDMNSTDNHITDVIAVRGKIANFLNRAGNNFYSNDHAFYGPIGFKSTGYTAGSQFVNCESDTPSAVGFDIASSGTILNGNRVFWATTLVGTEVGISIHGLLPDISIQGNNIMNTDAAHKIVSDAAISPTSIITNNKGALIDTGNNGATNFSVQYGDALTVTNGNARGVGAADLQFVRNNPAQVASGANSFAAGYGNEVSGFASAAVGSLHKSSGVTNFMAGQRGSDRGMASSFVLSGGQFSVLGDQQLSTHVLSLATTSTTSTRLSTGGAGISFSTALSMPATICAYLCDITLTGLKTTTGDAAYWTAKVLIRKTTTSNGSTVVAGSPTFTAGEGTTLALTAVPSIAADTTYGGLALFIAAPDTGSWHWVARVNCVQVA